MVTQLIKHERIETTVAKAKELRRVADRVITYGKTVRHVSLDSGHSSLQGSEHSRRMATEYVRGEAERFKLLTDLVHRYEFREGGYTRIIRSRTRHSDTAKMAYIEYGLVTRGECVGAFRFVDRVGELRPAKPPLKSFLPKAAEALAQMQGVPQLEGKSEEKKSEEKSEEAKKPSGRFFGLF